LLHYNTACNVSACNYSFFTYKDTENTETQQGRQNLPFMMVHDIFQRYAIKTLEET